VTRGRHGPRRRRDPQHRRLAGRRDLDHLGDLEKV
jgi:hypothetical protein